MPFFSVIIPAYNRLPYLMEALDSVSRQEFTDYEVIVIDDGSTDGTAATIFEMLKGGNAETVPVVYGREDWQRQPELQVERERPSQKLKLKYIRQENAGPGAARNRGIEVAAGKYIAFLDSDDSFFPWTLQTYREVIQSSGAGLVFGKPHHFKNSDDLKNIDAPVAASIWNSFDDYFTSGDEWRWWGASSFVVRSDILNGVRFVEESINGEDADFVMKLGSGIRLAQVLDVPTFAYREHEGSIMKNFDKTLAGAWNLVQSEKSGRYPGGKVQEQSRRVILGRHIRPVILELLRSGRKVDGWNLFCETLPWHIQQQRWRFVLATLLLKIKPL